MKIALDYDHTYSADPKLWNGFIFAAQGAGHDIRIVTARDDRFDRTEKILAAGERVDVIYTRGIAKRWYCEHFVKDFAPDVWIDDKPESIIANSDFSAEDLAKWRATRDEGIAAVPGENFIRSEFTPHEPTNLIDRRELG